MVYRTTWLWPILNSRIFMEVLKDINRKLSEEILSPDQALTMEMSNT